MIAVAVATADGNRAASLLRCIAAIAAGSLQPSRLLVVDQSEGSEIAAALAGLELAFPVEHLRQARLGLSASRNRALEHLDEPIVAITDDDCAPEAGWLAAVAEAFTGSPDLAAVTGPVLPMPAEGDRTVAVSSRARSGRRDFVRSAAPWHVGTGGNMALSRAALGALRFDTRLGVGTPGLAGEDLDLVYRLLAAGGRIRFVPDAAVSHERQTVARRWQSRFAYGHGVGAMLGLGVRRGDMRLFTLLARWLILRARLAARDRPVREEARVLQGTIAGFSYGIRGR
jgi:GT2 family glycosyltransferase